MAPTEAELRAGVRQNYTEYAARPDPACAAGYKSWGYGDLDQHLLTDLDFGTASGGGCPLAHHRPAIGSTVIDLGSGECVLQFTGTLSVFPKRVRRK